MTPPEFRDFCFAIAARLSGTISDKESGANMGDLYAIDLPDPIAGLTVVLRRGYGSERTRVRASMSLQSLKGECDFRELPPVHELSTAAAMSRGANAVAAQIEAKIITPAIPMRDKFVGYLERKRVEAEAFAKYLAGYQELFPDAAIDGRGSFRLWFDKRRRYIDARINADGTFYVERMSSVPPEKALRILAILTEVE